MLVLSRKTNESIMIGDEVEVIVLDVREGIVKLGIKAPRTISVHREEVYAEIIAENNRQAQERSQDAVESAAKVLKGSIPKKVKRTIEDETRRAAITSAEVDDDSIIRELGKNILNK